MNAFSLQQKEAVLVAFRISKLRELKNLGPWKLIENFLILVLHCGKIKMLRTSSAIRMHMACHQKHVIEAIRK